MALFAFKVQTPLKDKAGRKENTMDTPTQGQEEQTPQTAENAAGQGQVQSPEGQQESPQEFLERTGFKSLAEAEKSYKEAQKKITEQGQKLSQFESALQGQYTQSQQRTAAPPTGQGADFFDDPEGHVARLARQIASEEVSGAVQQLEAKQSITRVRSENPARFDALRPLVQQVYVEKPYLNTMGEDGLRQAMEEAATRRQSYLADLKAEMFPDQSGETNPTDVKQQAKNEVLAEQERARQATIPGTGASRPPLADAREKQRKLIED
jgi:hypothetical protein